MAQAMLYLTVRKRWTWYPLYAWGHIRALLTYVGVPFDVDRYAEWAVERGLRIEAEGWGGLG